MDVLGLRRERWGSGPDDESLYPLVNGRELVGLVREAELGPAAADGQPRLAGEYDGLTPWEWMRIGALLAGTSDHARLADGRVALLRCPCGVTECWPLVARFEIGERTVEIDRFEQPFRPRWRYDGLGPFVFVRAQMVDAIQAAVGG
jgi:hypothetical protein